MYNEIIELIKHKKKNIDDITLKYLTNYLYVVKSKNVLPPSVSFDEIVNNVLRFEKIEFFDDNHYLTKKNGKDFKGLRDIDSKTLFIRDSLDDTLKEITIYHELHHAAQTPLANLKTGECGINQDENYGRMIMEAQTQWFAEEIYKSIHNVDFREKEIPSENLRMQSGGTVVSSLHNYELYDSMLSKLSIVIEEPKEFFVTINYLYDNDQGMKKLEEKYNQALEKHKTKYDFLSMMYIFDYVYATDLMGYVENPNKRKILSGEETTEKYRIYSNVKDETLSLAKQERYITSFDTTTFMTLLENDYDCSEFAKYILNNQKREIVNNYLGKNKDEVTNVSTSSKKN